MTELTIDQEFHDLIPPLKPEELEKLRKSILADGCLDPIKVWNDTIIDGHNRYEICRENGRSFQTTPMSFVNRDEAKAWILQNQLARRNLNDAQRAVIALKLEELIEAKAKERQATSTGGKKPQLLTKSTKAEPVHTRKAVAKAAGVSEDTIRKVKAVEEKGTPEQKERMLKGEVSINKAYQETVPPKETPPPDIIARFKAIWEKATDEEKKRIREIVPDEYMKAILEIFKGVSLELIREHQAEGRCPCCGAKLESPTAAAEKAPPPQQSITLSSKAIAALKEKFPDADIEREWKTCQETWTADRKEIKRPKMAFQWWLKKRAKGVN